MSFSYAIIANPVAGGTSLDEKYKILKNAARLIGAKIYGLDTTSKQEFRECIKTLCSKYDVIIAAGGDGTFSDLINSIDLSVNIAGYLPMGTGNAIRYAIGYPGSVIQSANRIKYGRIHKFDLIKCFNTQYAFMVSTGFEVEVIKEYIKMKRRKISFKLIYIIAGLRAISKYIKARLPLSTKIYIDKKKCSIKDATSIIVTKQPYYGYGMKVMPHARFDNGLLHIGIFPPGIINIMLMVILSFSIGNIIGFHYNAKQSVLLDFFAPMGIHIDGDFAGNAKKIELKLIKKALQIII